MSENKTLCIVYRRSRYAERRADHFAKKQQDEAVEALAARGFEIVGMYGDPEFAPPFAGYLEPRPAWQMALDAAAEKCVTHGNCSLVVLRSDGIGDGDPFLPDRSLLAEYARVDIRVAGLSLRGHPTDMNLAAAHRYMDRFIKVERTEHFRQLIEIGLSDNQHDVILRRDPFRNIVRAYFANYGPQALRVRWQAYAKSLAQDARWPRAVDWDELEVLPKSAIHLHSFIQGDSSPKLHWWRFKVGKKRETRVGNMIVAPQDLAAASLPMTWYAFEPEGLGPEDFQWEDAPRMETKRLVFRNWREQDLQQYDAICNSPETMEFLGGQLSTAEVADDLEYFQELGISGPTYWAIERKCDGQLIGFCGLLMVEEDDTSIAGEWEIGWRFASFAQGDGLALEAASAVVKAAFEQWDLSRIVCRIHPENVASRRLAKRLGLCIDASRVGESEITASEGTVYFMSENMYLQLGRGPAALEGVCEC